MLRRMADLEEVWLPLVDEPIGEIVAQIQADDPEIGRLVESPHRILAFKTFAYIRVGMLLGELLVDHELEPYDGSETWVDQLMKHPEYKRRIVEEVRRVAEEVAADPRYGGDERLGPDEAARERFREFAKKQLG